MKLETLDLPETIRGWGNVDDNDKWLRGQTKYSLGIRKFHSPSGDRSTR